MRLRHIVLTLVMVTLLGLWLETATADDPGRPTACVSAVGPVDASGQGASTAVESGECPKRLERERAVGR
jgi:hypothetical protein